MIFFFASCGASAAYLTVSEIFPVEVRAKAIAVFFAIAQTFGAMGPWLYGMLIGSGQDHTKIFVAYLIGAAVMLIGGSSSPSSGCRPNEKSLEDVASPLSAVRRPSSSSDSSGRNHQAIGASCLTATAHQPPTAKNSARMSDPFVR